jgi:hypothetical protein
MGVSTRRDFLKTAGNMAVGAIAFGGISSLTSCAAKDVQNVVLQPTSSTPPLAPVTVTATANPVTVTATAASVALPWPYKKLDSVAAAERAYVGYSNGGCMYGAFEGIVGELRAGVGAPYDTFPTAMTKYGGAGVSGWGTLCGALNGIAAALYLFLPQTAANLIINEVFGWYGATALPDYNPLKPKFATMKKSIADSQLCHQSVTKWCKASGFITSSPERADRCAWLTASVVRYTVDLTNKQADGAFKQTFVVPASVTSCLSCHGKGGLLEDVHITNQTDCYECHTVLGSQHPVITK